MKKLIIASIALFFVAITSVNAQAPTTVPAPVTNATEKAQPEKSAVKIEELPDAVKAAIASDDYKGWDVKAAFIIKGDKTYYEINFVKGTEVTIVNFDKNGKRVVA